MNRAIIIHGMLSKNEYYINGKDSPSNSHWLPWLQQQLCRQDILAQTPEMPRPFTPEYEVWKNEFERFEPDENTLLVGHSCGGGFLVRWLSENTDKIVGKVVLVAPWLDIERKRGSLFDFVIKSDLSIQSKKGIDLLYSTDDMTDIKTSINHLRQNTENLRYHEFINYGHFVLDSMRSREFPELLQICLND